MRRVGVVCLAFLHGDHAGIVNRSTGQRFRDEGRSITERNPGSAIQQIAMTKCAGNSNRVVPEGNVDVHRSRVDQPGPVRCLWRPSAGCRTIVRIAQRSTPFNPTSRNHDFRATPRSVKQFMPLRSRDAHVAVKRVKWPDLYRFLRYEFTSAITGVRNAVIRCISSDTCR